MKNFKKVLFILFLTLLLIWSIFIEPNMLEVKHYNIKDNNLAGLKIVFVGDFHIKKYELKRLQKTILKINEQNPDLVLCIGDFVSGHNKKSSLSIQEITKELVNVKSKYGFYTVLGNHDNWYDKVLITKALKGNKIKILDNSNQKITICKKYLYIAGVEDLTTDNPNVYQSLKNTKNPVILLTHNPDVFPKVPKEVNLTLAGHTHGGQVVLPLLGALIVPAKDKYAQGFIIENNKKMIVTKGLGTSILPIRFNCKPEIIVIQFE